MDNLKSEALSELGKKMAKLNKITDAIMGLPDFGEDTRLYESCETICISIPFDLKRIREVRKALGAKWKVSSKPRTMDDGDWVVDFDLKEDPEIELTLFARTWLDGATCHRVFAGYKRTKIYRIECDGKEVASGQPVQ